MARYDEGAWSVMDASQTGASLEAVRAWVQLDVQGFSSRQCVQLCEDGGALLVCRLCAPGQLETARHQTQTYAEGF